MVMDHKRKTKLEFGLDHFLRSEVIPLFILLEAERGHP
jgi:hypothetical protein